MKRLLLFLALLCAATLTISSAPRVTSPTDGATKERATVKFDKPMVLMGVELKGTYLFIHDDEAMARGDACTYVYKGLVESRDKLVVSFHCKPKDRDKVNHFTLRSITTPDGKDELTEFQFGGSTEGHMVPVAVP